MTFGVAARLAGTLNFKRLVYSGKSKVSRLPIDNGIDICIVELRDSLPMTATGKILKKELRGEGLAGLR